jgi:FG-GAP repeat protein
MRRIMALGAALTLLFAVAPAELAFARTGTSGGASVSADFDADGVNDLAVGVPFEDVSGATNGGGVNVIYGSPTGLTAGGDQFWSQDSPGIAESAGSNDYFGRSLATADLNGDGFTDLAVGVPQEDVTGSMTDDGGVNVIYGSPTGLTASGNQFFSQDTAGILGQAEPAEQFGNSLAAANFGGSSHADLAVGSLADNTAAPGHGSVNVVYGSPTGLTASGDQLWTQDSAGIFGSAERGDAFGWSLAAANFGESSHADLAIGVPFESLAATTDGGVHVIYGSSTGLTASGSQFWNQDSAGIFGRAESGDHFGESLAAANFGDSFHADLAVGVPLENLAAVDDGGVNVIYGASSGLTAAGNQFWGQDEAGIFGRAEPGDHFGESLAAANFGGNSQADLAVGVPSENFAANDDGGVNVIYGASGGLTAIGDEFWGQNEPGVLDEAQADDRFGSSVAAANFDGNSQADLAVGVPGEDFGSTDDGGVNVVYGAVSGLDADGDQFWGQDSAGIVGVGEVGDRFGASLATDQG